MKYIIALASLMLLCGFTSLPPPATKTDVSSGGGSPSLSDLLVQANHGNAQAQFQIGSMYQYGQGVVEDYSEAFSWYKRAADQAYAPAEYALGSFYQSGAGVATDYVAGLEWYKRAAERGYAPAEYELAEAYLIPPIALADREGTLRVLGHVPDLQAAALGWYKRSAAHGDARAQYDLCMAYTDARFGLPNDRALAFDWCKRAADQGLAVAQYQLGSMYQSGQGVKRDLAAALPYYERSAAQYNARAEYQIALAYNDGCCLSLPYDRKEAAIWFRRAADHGYGSKTDNTGGVFSLLAWANQDPQFKVSFIKSVIQIAAEKGVVTIRLPPEYYAHELDGVVANLMNKGDQQGLNASVAGSLETIVIMDCDWDNGSNRFTSAEKYIGPTTMNKIRQLYPEKYRRLRDGCK